MTDYYNYGLDPSVNSALYDPTVEDFALDLQVVQPGKEQEAFSRMGDGKNYSRGLYWQSPEGNFYGHQRFVKTWMIPIFWDGRAYKDISKLDGIVASKDELPPDPSSHIGQVWGVPNGKDISHPDIDLDLVRGIAYDLYFYNVDKEEWDEVVWLFDIYGRCNIPYPGVKVGACHRLILYDVPVFWDGYVWRQHRHSNLDNDEPERHLPAGFISLVPADVELVYVSKSLMALRKV
ncbi:MAG: hypothetical protein ACP5JL_09830, partial [bacterium]